MKDEFDYSRHIEKQEKDIFFSNSDIKVRRYSTSAINNKNERENRANYLEKERKEVSRSLKNIHLLKENGKNSECKKYSLNFREPPRRASLNKNLKVENLKDFSQEYSNCSFDKFNSLSRAKSYNKICQSSMRRQSLKVVSHTLERFKETLKNKLAKSTEQIIRLYEIMVQNCNIYLKIMSLWYNKHDKTFTSELQFYKKEAIETKSVLKEFLCPENQSKISTIPAFYQFINLLLNLLEFLICTLNGLPNNYHMVLYKQKDFELITLMNLLSNFYDEKMETPIKKVTFSFLSAEILSLIKCLGFYRQSFMPQNNQNISTSEMVSFIEESLSDFLSKKAQVLELSITSRSERISEEEYENFAARVNGAVRFLNSVQNDIGIIKPLNTDRKSNISAKKILKSEKIKTNSFRNITFYELKFLPFLLEINNSNKFLKCEEFFNSLAYLLLILQGIQIGIFQIYLMFKFEENELLNAISEIKIYLQKQDEKIYEIYTKFEKLKTNGKMKNIIKTIIESLKLFSKKENEQIKQLSLKKSFTSSFLETEITELIKENEKILALIIEKNSFLIKLKKQTIVSKLLFLQFKIQKLILNIYLSIFQYLEQNNYQKEVINELLLHSKTLLFEGDFFVEAIDIKNLTLSHKETLEKNILNELKEMLIEIEKNLELFVEEINNKKEEVKNKKHKKVHINTNIEVKTYIKSETESLESEINEKIIKNHNKETVSNKKHFTVENINSEIIQQEEPIPFLKRQIFKHSSLKKRFSIK